MPSLYTYSPTAASNNSVGGISIIEGCAPGNLNDMGRALMADTALWLLAAFGGKTTGGAAGAQTLTSGLNVTTLAAGQVYGAKIGVGLTTVGATTLAIDGLVARPVKKAAGGVITDIGANDMVAGAVSVWVYEATADILLLLNPAAGGTGLTGDLDTNGNNIQFDTLTGIEDSNGNEQLIFQAVASAVNYIRIVNAATGNPPQVVADGSDTNVDLYLGARGTGVVRFATNIVPHTTGGFSLGTSGLPWANLFLKVGSVIDFGAGDVQVTHSANALAFTGGTISFDTMPTVTGVTFKKAGRETIFVPKGAFVSRTTNGAASGSVEKATNKNMLSSWDFDPNTQEFIQTEVWFPKSWNRGTISYQPEWSHAATTTNFGVTWGLAAVARSNADPTDVAFGTAVTSVDTGGTTDALYIGPESGPVTVAGSPAVDDSVQLQLNRTVSDGGDTMAIDARFHGMRIFFTTNAADDT